MNKLRTYLTRKDPPIVDCQEAAGVLDDYVAGYPSDRQRRIFEWHISQCGECSKRLNEYHKSLAPDTSSFDGEDEDGQPGSPEGVQAFLATDSEDFGAFSSSPPFRGLAMPDLQRIFAHGEILELEQGATVIEEGKVNLNLYVVLSGEFQVSLPAGPQRYGEVALATRHAPDCFGEYAFIDYKLASASVSATRESRLFKIAFNILDNFIDSDAELGRSIYENILLLVIARLRADDVELDLFKTT